MKKARKPFVAPQIKEQASLADVTLISGGGGTPTVHGQSSSHPNHGHGHGHQS